MEQALPGRRRADGRRRLGDHLPDLASLGLSDFSIAPSSVKRPRPPRGVDDVAPNFSPGIRTAVMAQTTSFMGATAVELRSEWVDVTGREFQA